jgi:predicted DNA-binding ribbon-helix-helix protein
MCKIYLARDPIQYECRSRTLRIHGVVTTIRLENEFWNVLQKIAESEAKTTNELINQFYDEAACSSSDGAPRNFASVLRVTCCRYLDLNASTTARLEPLPVPGVRSRAAQLEVVSAK